MGNQQGGAGGGEGMYDDPEFQRTMLQYLRNRGQQQSRYEEPPKPARIKYTVNESTNDNYVIYTNNLFEAKVKKSIVKKQDNFYSNYHRKLRQTSKKSRERTFDNLAEKLEIPPVHNSYAKTMETMLPNKRKRIDEVDSSIYNIVFNSDGSQLLVTTKERLHLYEEKDGQYVAGKVLNPRNVTWTITDSDLSPCGRYLIHCSLNSFVSIFDIQLGKYSNFYNFNDESNEDYVDDDYWERLRFFSCKYSGDGTKILASSGVGRGQKALIKVFDIAAERICDSIEAHDDDINSIAFVNKLSSSVFISGSDDRLVKIWDTRALGSRGGNSAGEMIGHVAGITHVDSRQDNYYVASNGKDSCVKLWDLRKSESTSNSKPRKNLSFDYRGHALSDDKIEIIRGFSQAQNFDNSVHSFRGHKVGGTLMRCHFSPLGPTDRRYIYTASQCGKLFIYDILSGKTTSEIKGDFQEEKTGYTAAILNDLERSPIRDAIWHPQKMEIITTNLNGQLFKWHHTKLFQEKNTPLQEINVIDGVDHKIEEEGGGNSDNESVETIQNTRSSSRRQRQMLFQTDNLDDSDNDEPLGEDGDEEVSDGEEEDDGFEDVEDDDEEDGDDDDEDVSGLKNEISDSGDSSLQNFIIRQNPEETPDCFEDDSNSRSQNEESSEQIKNSEEES